MASPSRSPLPPSAGYGPLWRLTTDLDRFDAELRASSSATATLVDWVRVRTGAADTTVTAHVRTGAATKPSPELLEHLQVKDVSDIAYRRVWLAHAGRVLSDAENWYVPDRLTEGMRHMLADGKTPFGQIVEPLIPLRETLSVTRLWRPGPGTGTTPERLPTRLLHHHALVRDRTGRPICEVSEIYTRSILL